MFLPKKWFQLGFIDPVTVTVVGFLVVGLVVGTVALFRGGSTDDRSQAAPYLAPIDAPCNRDTDCESGYCGKDPLDNTSVCRPASERACVPNGILKGTGVCCSNQSYPVSGGEMCGAPITPSISPRATNTPAFSCDTTLCLNGCYASATRPNDCKPYCKALCGSLGCASEDSQGGVCNGVCRSSGQSCDPNSATGCCSGLSCINFSCQTPVACNTTQCPNGCVTGTTTCSPYCNSQQAQACVFEGKICSPTSSGGTCLSPTSTPIVLSSPTLTPSSTPISRYARCTNQSCSVGTQPPDATHPSCVDDADCVGVVSCLGNGTLLPPRTSTTECCSGKFYTVGGITYCGVQLSPTSTRAPTPTIDVSTCAPSICPEGCYTGAGQVNDCKPYCNAAVCTLGCSAKTSLGGVCIQPTGSPTQRQCGENGTYCTANASMGLDPRTGANVLLCAGGTGVAVDGYCPQVGAVCCLPVVVAAPKQNGQSCTLDSQCASQHCEPIDPLHPISGQYVCKNSATTITGCTATEQTTCALGQTCRKVNGEVNCDGMRTLGTVCTLDTQCYSSYCGFTSTGTRACENRPPECGSGNLFTGPGVTTSGRANRQECLLSSGESRWQCSAGTVGLMNSSTGEYECTSVNPDDLIAQNQEAIQHQFELNECAYLYAMNNNTVTGATSSGRTCAYVLQDLDLTNSTVSECLASVPLTGIPVSGTCQTALAPGLGNNSASGSLSDIEQCLLDSYYYANHIECTDAVGAWADAQTSIVEAGITQLVNSDPQFWQNVAATQQCPGPQDPRSAICNCLLTAAQANTDGTGNFATYSGACVGVGAEAGLLAAGSVAVATGQAYVAAANVSVEAVAWLGSVFGSAYALAQQTQFGTQVINTTSQVVGNPYVQAGGLIIMNLAGGSQGAQLQLATTDAIPGVVAAYGSIAPYAQIGFSNGVNAINSWLNFDDVLGPVYYTGGSGDNLWMMGSVGNTNLIPVGGPQYLGSGGSAVVYSQQVYDESGDLVTIVIRNLQDPFNPVNSYSNGYQASFLAQYPEGYYSIDGRMIIPPNYPAQYAVNPSTGQLVPVTTYQQMFPDFVNMIDVQTGIANGTIPPLTNNQIINGVDDLYALQEQAGQLGDVAWFYQNGSPAVNPRNIGLATDPVTGEQYVVYLDFLMPVPAYMNYTTTPIQDEITIAQYMLYSFGENNPIPYPVANLIGAPAYQPIILPVDSSTRPIIPAAGD